MRRLTFLALAATVVIFGNTSSSQATLFLSYNSNTVGQNVTPVTTTNTSTTTTFTNNNSNGTAISVNLTLLNNVVIPVAYLNFTNFRSVNSVTTVGGNYYLQDYQGTMSFTQFANGTGINYLTATFSYVADGDNLYLNGSKKGHNLSGNVSSDQAAQLSYISTYYDFSKQYDVGAYNSASISISGLITTTLANLPNNVRGLTLDATKKTFLGFSGNISGDFSAEPAPPTGTPEPSTIAGAGLAIAAALGFGVRRRKVTTTV